MTLAVRCAWCKRYAADGDWVEENPEPDARTTHGICPGCYDRLHFDWPRHRPEAHDAPIPGRQWYGGCNPDGGRINPDTGRCDECGETACKTCGRQNCPDHHDEETTP